jgi:hypothetical protein
LTRGSLGPPCSFAVYVVASPSVASGLSVAVLVDALYVIVAGTSAFDGSRSSNVALLRVAGSIGSLNIAVMSASAWTPVALLAGDVLATVGAVVSGPVGVFMKTTSTQ